jgi:hypothetical protein
MPSAIILTQFRYIWAVFTKIGKYNAAASISYFWGMNASLDVGEDLVLGD